MTDLQLDLSQLSVEERMNIYRQKALEGTLTKEEQIEAVRWLRSKRELGAVRAATKKSKKEPVDSNALLDSFNKGEL